jgi:hypothetical protein
MENDPKDKSTPNQIERLERELYSRDYKPPAESRSRLNPAITDEVRNSWKGSPYAPRAARPRPLTDSFLKKIFIFAVIFFIVCLGAAAAIFFWGLNTISSDKVSVNYQGPISIAAGNELDFAITVTNNNNTPLLDPVLNITFPDGTKEASDLTVDYPRDQANLGTINVNATSQTPFKAVLFGAAQTVETIKTILQYQVKGSNTTFTKETDYQVTISSAPVSVTLTAPTSVIAGENIVLGVNVTSNSTAPLQNLLLTTQYPFGFQFATATPPANISNDVWMIPSLAPGQQSTFQISGTITGQEGDQPTFHFNVGVASTSNPGLMSINYLSTDDTIPIQQPALEADITFNGESGGTIVANQGDTVTGSITLTNHSSTQISDIQTTAAFSGPLLDPTSPTSDQGFYQSVNKSIVWNSTNAPALANLAPNQSVRLDFTLASLSHSQMASFTNGTMAVNVTATGQEVNQGANSPVSSNSAESTVEIQSASAITTSASYSGGPFKNTGPIPPRANTPTTYTITWNLSNGSDNLADAVVRATLPTYITWVGATSPKGENISYDSLSNQVIWRVGDVAAGTGQSQPAQEVSFQISFLPSTSQLGSSPILINNSTLQAVDTFTNQNITASAAAVDTRLGAAPAVSQSTSDVVQ